jgi:hypothetical protein
MRSEIKLTAIIKDTVRKSILDYAERSLHKKAKFQILDLIIPKERKIRSIVGGLETSLGTTLWEPLAKALAKNNGFLVKEENLEAPANMPANLGNVLANIISERERRSGVYDAEKSHVEIRETCQIFQNSRRIEMFVPAPKGYGVDIWLVKDGINYFFDTKTVQPNLGAFTNCMKQVLHWYAYFYCKHPDERAEARIVFPYNPHRIDFWDGSIAQGLPLEKNKEGWVENEFWNFCSGHNDTYLLIKNSFKELHESKELEYDLERLLAR